MDSKALSPSVNNGEAKAAFKKPSNDTGARRYRRRSPVGGSSSSEGSDLKDERSSSPNHLKEDYKRGVKEGERDLSRKSGRHYHHGRSGGETYRYSDHQSSRSSYDDSRRDKYTRRDKVSDKGESYYSKSRSDHAREEKDHYKSRHHSRGDDKYSRDRTDGSGHRHRNKDRDERRDYQRVDRKSDRSPAYDSGSQRDKAGHRLNEMSKSNFKESDGRMSAKEEKMKSVDQKTSKQIDVSDTKPREHLKESMFTSGNEDSLAKRQKSSSFVNDNEKDADEGKSSKHDPLLAGKVNSEQVLASGCTAADIDAAKRTAMKAAESVNKNLMGAGYMSADQKKKLLWGNKKSTPAEKQSSHPWDTVTFSDREQQEKFNKLMSLRLQWYIWPIVGCEGGSKSGPETREQRGPCGKAEGNAVRLGEAIHSWSSSERWSHCWTWPVTVTTSLLICACSCTFTYSVIFYFCIILSFLVIDFWFVRRKHDLFFSFRLLDLDQNWHLWIKFEVYLV